MDQSPELEPSQESEGAEPQEVDERGHGPYQPHEPGYGLEQPGYNPYEDEIPDPQARMLAIKNAKAYLLKTSTKSGLNL